MPVHAPVHQWLHDILERVGARQQIETLEHETYLSVAYTGQFILGHVSDKKIDPEMDDERRVYYRITGLGRDALAAELERYREVVAVARRKTLVPRAAHD